ncbi:DUF2283 domain-containing protein [Bacillus swezeyi]|uniref:DUF2283 domain-containing protein n=1 Tax=Bacillus swezeyi TaxID=1925020 RepID=UPI003F8C038E
MNILITYDDQAEMGYIYMTEKHTDPVTTEDIGETALMADLDRDNRIIGIEFSGDAAPDIARLGTIAGKKQKLEPAFLNRERVYSFRPNRLEAAKTILMNRVGFHFADTGCQHFIGFDVFDRKEKSE